MPYGQHKIDEHALSDSRTYGLRIGNTSFAPRNYGICAERSLRFGETLMLSGKTMRQIANRKPYVYASETVCLRLINIRFTHRKHTVYNTQTYGLQIANGSAGYRLAI